MIPPAVSAPVNKALPLDPSIDALQVLVAILPILSPTPSAVLIPTPAVEFKLIA